MWPTPHNLSLTLASELTSTLDDNTGRPRLGSLHTTAAIFPLGISPLMAHLSRALVLPTYQLHPHGLLPHSCVSESHNTTRVCENIPGFSEHICHTDDGLTDKTSPVAHPALEASAAWFMTM